VTIYQLAFTGLSASTDGAASQQILKRGTIKQATFWLQAVTTTAGSGMEVELSKIPYAQTGVTGANLGPIAVCGNRTSFVTSGGYQTGENVIVPLNHPIGQLEYLYLNVIEAGTVSSLNATVLVYVQD